MNIAPPPAGRRAADETFQGLDDNLGSFWSFALSDLRTNVARGWLAEYLVWRAMGIEKPQRVEWDTCDVKAQGLEIEVKSSGYLQAWPQTKLSELRFTGLRSRAWSTDTNVLDEQSSYHADVYVFAVQTAQTHEAYDALDLDQWKFAALSRRKLKSLGVASIAWSSVLKEVGHPTHFAAIPDVVKAAHRENGEV